MEHPPSTEKTGARAGDVIDGNLEIESVIAEGITSTVVSARNLNDGTRVAVKIARGSDLESTERFRRAARGMAKLTSPHAVRVISVGQTKTGQPCMSMEYLEGRTLATKLLQQGPLPIDEAVRYMLQACEAVAEAHAKALLHRDLDAENLFLVMPPMGTSEPASIRVLDFALTPIWRMNKGDGRLKPGDAAGTSFAIAPELARGADLDDRVDIWGAGACLFRLLTNRYPFNARNLAELCTRVLSERAPEVAKIRPEVTFQLSGVVKRCLEREAADRYPSMEALIDALRDTLDEAPHTPHVHTGTATLAQLREGGAMTLRDTPRIMRAANSDVISSAPPLFGEDDDATSVFGRAHVGPPPRTVRTVPPPSFEALGAALEPHQRRAPHIEDGPSTQPLGRLSPFAELTKRGSEPEPEDEPPPRSDQEESIIPQLVPVSDAFLPPPKISSNRDVFLKKPSPAVMAMETAPPPPLPPPLPVVSPAMSAQETIQRTEEPPQLIFTGAPRTLAMPPMTDTGSFLPPTPPPAAQPSPLSFPSVPPVSPVFTGPPPAVMMSAAPPPVFTGPPPPVFTGPPPPVFTGPPPMSDPAFAVRELPTAPAFAGKKRKRSLVIPLLFAFAAAASVVIGLKVAKVTLPTTRTIASATPSGSAMLAATAAPPPSATTPAILPTTPTTSDGPAPPPPLPEAADAGEIDPQPIAVGGSATHHRVRPPPAPRPRTNPVPASPSPAPAPAPVRSGSIYDPGL